jgi:hypothetical protein
MGWKRFLSVVWGPPGFRGLNVSVRTESLVLVARAGFFIPNGNDNRSHRANALQALRNAGAEAAELVLMQVDHRFNGW